MKKRFVKKILVWSILVFSIVTFSFKACGNESHLYYIPQVNLYIKLHSDFYSDTVHVYLGHNKKGPFNEESDYLKSINKLPISIIVNPNKNNKFIFPSYVKGVLKVHSKEFIIERSKSEMTDTTFYYPQIGTEPRILKNPYLCISISEYMEGVFIKESGKGYFDKIDECR